MRFIGDFHIHSKYSRAVSKQMTIPMLDRWADDKGILVMGTGDFTHPLWIKHLKETLEPAESGLFRVKKQYQEKTIKGTIGQTRFILSVEISSIYSRDGRTRRVHNIILAPDFKTIESINAALLKAGAKLSSDGRPIVGLDAREVAKIAFTANPEAVVIPAHIWTPWFALFGSMSGFNTIEECFGEYGKQIFAMETGLSSDPAMNWRLSMLDHIALISNSDSHSLERIGREANIFDTELSYQGIISALKQNDPKTFVATIEYYPEEGKYHYDGHRACGISWTPDETKKHRGICSSCGRPVVVGVMNRVDRLADRDEVKPEQKPFEQVIANHHQKRVPYINLVTLDSIIGEAFDVGVKSKAVWCEYEKLIKAFKTELDILMKIPLTEFAAVATPEVVEGLKRMRLGQLSITPGYDGEYGVVKIFNSKEKKAIANGNTLFN